MAVELGHPQNMWPLIVQPKFPHFRHPCEATISLSLMPCVFDCLRFSLLTICHLYFVHA